MSSPYKRGEVQMGSATGDVYELGGSSIVRLVIGVPFLFMGTHRRLMWVRPGCLVPRAAGWERVRNRVLYLYTLPGVLPGVR
jgi:hypothetical protein